MAKRVSKRQVGVVMREFGRGRLRMPSGKRITKHKQAVAVALSEGRAAGSRGVAKRTFKGRTRMRPRKR